MITDHQRPIAGDEEAGDTPAGEGAVALAAEDILGTEPSHAPDRDGLLSRLLGALGELVLRHRMVFLVGIVLLAVGGGLAVRRIRVDFTVQELFARRDADIAFLERFKERFGADDDLLLILVQAEDVLRPDVLAAVDRLTAGARRLPAFRGVQSLTTVSDLGPSGGSVDTRPLCQTLRGDREGLRRRLLGSPLVAGRFISRDGTLASVALHLREGSTRARELEAAVETVEALVARTALPPGTRTHFIGVPYVRTEAVRLVRSDQLRFLPLGCAVTALLLILLYRRLHEVVIPIVAVDLSAGLTVALMALTGAPIDIISNVLPLLVMVYGIADAVHLLARVDEEERGGAPRARAVQVSMRRLGLACLVTSATTAVGFASLATAQLSLLRRFGLYAAAGVVIAYLITILVVPLGVSLRRRSSPRRAPAPRLVWLDGLLARVAALGVGHPRLILALALLGGVGAVILGSRVEVNNYLLGIYQEDHPSARATRLAERALDGVVTLQVSMRGQAGAMKEPRVLVAMHRLQAWLARQEGVTSTLSLATFVGELHRVVVGQGGIPREREGVAQLLLMAEGQEALGRLVDPGFGWARIVVSMKDLGARRFLALAETVRARLPAAFAGLGVEPRVTGTSLVAYHGINRLVLDLLTSLSWAFLVIAAMLALTFRSPWIGLLSLLPNVLPLAVGLAFMVLAGLALEPATVIVFSIALGIAVDDTIHFFSRYHEEMRRGHSPTAAVTISLRTAGRAMVFTSLILIGGFSTTILSNFPGTTHFGLIGVVILTTALVADLLVTPACLLVFKPWWRPPSG